ncbi:hypothetical protein ABZ281_16050 [Streptomyces sp. NPDC006265]|uniref:hypothetical protein n=1 Tax=Streptomyces sp. NPDC006265 TaxID=3156740 RepID=UPI0033A7C318
MEIHVRPAQPQQLTAPQADANRQLVRGPQSVVSGRREKLTSLLDRERFYLALRSHAQLHVPGHIAGQLVFTHCVL